MKRFAAIVAVMGIVLVSGLFAEGQKESDGTVRIGLSQFVQHPALDAVVTGIKDELAVLGYDKVEYDYQNSNADINTTKQIASMFKMKNYDMVVGIATPNAQALKSTITGTPIVYTAITDPVSAGLTSSLNQGEAGICGVSHRTPFKAQLQYLMGLTEVKSLGMVYSGNESNALFQVKETKAACEALGIEFIGSAVTSSAEVKAATESLMGRVDAMYVGTDNTVISALSGLATTALANKVPVLSADPSSAMENPVFAAWGFDWYYVGQVTARLMDEVLKGKSCEDLPTVLIEDTAHMQLILNTTVAAELGIKIPQSDLDRAKIVN